MDPSVVGTLTASVLAAVSSLFSWLKSRKVEKYVEPNGSNKRIPDQLDTIAAGQETIMSWVAEHDATHRLLLRRLNVIEGTQADLISEDQNLG